MFEISATFDMLRRNLPTFILPDLSVNIIDTIACYCFVCKKNEICKFSYKEGLCHDCFNAKYDLKLCVVCNKKTYKGGLFKGCNMKQGNEIKTKKCMDCNRNQAKCKGGLCRGCYKKQGHDGKT